MKFWVSAYGLKKHKAGVGTYYHTIEQCLRLNNINYEEFTCKTLEVLSFLKYKSLLYFLWLNTFFYIKTLIFKPDIVFFPTACAPLFKVKDVTYIATFHDLGMEENIGGFGKNAAILSKFFHKITINNVNKITCVSEFVRQDLLKKYPTVDKENTYVLYNSLQEEYSKKSVDNDICKKYNITPNKYLLAVGELRKNKNTKSLLDAFLTIKNEIHDVKLVIVGSLSNDKSFLNIKDDKIIFTGYVDTSDLISLYKNAMMYVFPSVYEGFGIPLIEAQSCGCPVVCSDIPVFREIAGDSAAFFKPTIQGIAEELSSLINNPSELSELSIRGSENVKRFMIDKIAKRFQQIVLK